MPARIEPLRRARSASRAAALRPALTVRLRESLDVYAQARGVAIERSAGVCEICVHHPATQTQHRIRRGMGGSTRNPAIHRVSNLIRCCATCHHDADQHTDRFAFGWSVHRGQDPVAVPVLLGGSFVLLDDEGGVAAA